MQKTIDRHILQFFVFILVAELCAAAVKLSRINDACLARGFAGVGVEWQEGFYCRAKPPEAPEVEAPLAMGVH